MGRHYGPIFDSIQNERKTLFTEHKNELTSSSMAWLCREIFKHTETMMTVYTTRENI